MISQSFVVHYQLNYIASKVQSVRLADSCILAIIDKATFFSVQLRKLQVSFLGSIMPEINHDLIAGMKWMRHRRPYIDWDTSVIILARTV